MFLREELVAGNCETVRDNIQREEREKTKEQTKRWGILKKRMTKDKYNRTGKWVWRMGVRGRKEKMNKTDCKTKDIASHLDDEAYILLLSRSQRWNISKSSYYNTVKNIRLFLSHGGINVTIISFEYCKIKIRKLPGDFLSGDGKITRTLEAKIINNNRGKEWRRKKRRKGEDRKEL